MSRFGWSLTRQDSSPYSSMRHAPAVTNDDFSYITSEDLNEGRRGRDAGAADDILKVKHRGVTWPAHFPPYSIGDGKLAVKDVKHRVGLLMGLSDRRTHGMKLLFKGRQLKDADAAVREYGVKSESELMAVIPEDDRREPEEEEEEELVIVNEEESRSQKRKAKKKASKKKKSDRGDDSASNSNMDSPRSPPTPQPRTPLGPMQKLEELEGQFQQKWLPLCLDYIKAPPAGEKKREEEHRKISESIMAQIVLKLDEVDTDGNPEIRTKRKALVKEVQDTLKKLDIAKAS